MQTVTVVNTVQPSWDCWLVGWLAASRPSNMLVYLRDSSAQTSVNAATLRRELQIKRSDTVPTSPSADPITTGAWQRRHWSTWYDSTRKKIYTEKAGIEPFWGRTPYPVGQQGGAKVGQYMR